MSCQIFVELGYLVILLTFSVIIMLDAAISTEINDQTRFVTTSVLGFTVELEVAKWIALTFSGMLGGIVFDFKWLYHAVAYHRWNQDRILWRLVVPINSSIVSLFTGFLFASGVIPFLRNEAFDNMYTILGFGFVFGYFSDNILAAFQNLAHKIFGTLSSD